MVAAVSKKAKFSATVQMIHAVFISCVLKFSNEDNI